MEIVGSHVSLVTDAAPKAALRPHLPTAPGPGSFSQDALETLTPCCGHRPAELEGDQLLLLGTRGCRPCRVTWHHPRTRQAWRPNSPVLAPA